MFILAQEGKLKHFKDDEGYEAACRVWNALGLNKMQFNKKSSEPVEEQFWKHFDLMFNVTETGMRKALPHFCVDPNNRAKVEALLHQQQIKN